MRFREVEKAAVPGQVPAVIAGLIRDIAHEHRRNLAHVATEALCRGLGIDPREYGIDKPVLPCEPSHLSY